MKDFRRLELTVDCDTHKITASGDQGFYFGDNNSIVVTLVNTPVAPEPEEGEEPVELPTLRVIINAVLPGGGVVSQSMLPNETGLYPFEDIDTWLVKTGKVLCQLVIATEEEQPVIITENNFEFDSLVKYGVGNDEVIDSKSTDYVTWEDMYKAKRQIDNLSDNISATVTENEEGAVVKITDLKGTTTAQLYNGEQGPQGERGMPGIPGVDGFSPVANVTQEGNDTIITITDKTGTTTATINTTGYDDTEIRRQLAAETTNRQSEDVLLQNQIDALEDEVADTWNKSESDSRYVAKTQKVNNKALSGDINLTASDVGALPDSTVIPTKTSELTNDSDYVSDANYVHTDNNFTDAEKTKLAGIEAGAEVNVQSNWNETDTSSDAYIANKPTIPTDTNDLTNGAGYITSAALQGYATEAYVQNYVNSLNANNTQY